MAPRRASASTAASGLLSKRGSCGGGDGGRRLVAKGLQPDFLFFSCCARNKTKQNGRNRCQWLLREKPSEVPRNQCAVIRARGRTCPFGGFEYDAAAFTVLAEFCTCTGQRVPTMQQPVDTMSADFTLLLVNRLFRSSASENTPTFHARCYKMTIHGFRFL